MSLVIDASVFVSAARDEEAEYPVSIETLNRIARSNEEILCPVIVLPECAGALARLSQKTELARRVLDFIELFPRLRLIDFNLHLAESASEIAVTCRLKGVDACYVALAEAENATLLTLDREMLQRAASVVRTLTPSQWLQANRE